MASATGARITIAARPEADTTGARTVPEAPTKPLVRTWASPSDAALAFYRIPNKRIAYTFGSDEINQTVTTFNPTTQAVLTTEVHTFGHDGHGSVRVLFDAASRLAQAYTYAAYGELLANLAKIR